MNTSKYRAPLFTSLLTLSVVSGACTTDSGDDLLTASEAATSAQSEAEATSDSSSDSNSGETTQGDGDADTGDGDSGDGDSGDGDSGDGDSGDGDSGDGDSGDGDSGDGDSGDGDSGDGDSGDGDSGDGDSGDGDSGDGDTGDGDTGDGDPCADFATMIVRDFSDAHPDFQHPPWPEPWGPHANMVAAELGVDGKPELNLPITQPQQFSSEANFDQWYNTDPSAVSPYNYEYTVQLPLTEESPGVFVYESDYFHPIGPADGFGSEGYVEQEGPDTGSAFNWHFTTETTFTFKYQGDEAFTFTGDDDFWGYIDGHLVVDLGGIHGPASQTVVLSSDPALTDLVVGQDYEVKLFHAERRHWGSSFRLETTKFCLLPE